MRKIMRNRAYDTDKSTLVGEWDNGLPEKDFRWTRERLYRKQKTGEYFLHGMGGATTQYARRAGSGWTDGEMIVPMEYEAAKRWGQEHLSPEAVEAEWAVPDDTRTERVTLIVSHAAKTVLKHKAAQAGEPMSAVVERMIMESR